MRMERVLMTMRKKTMLFLGSLKLMRMHHLKLQLESHPEIIYNINDSFNTDDHGAGD